MCSQTYNTTNWLIVCSRYQTKQTLLLPCVIRGAPKYMFFNWFFINKGSCALNLLSSFQRGGCAHWVSTLSWCLLKRDFGCTDRCDLIWFSEQHGIVGASHLFLFNVQSLLLIYFERIPYLTPDKWPVPFLALKKFPFLIWHRVQLSFLIRHSVGFAIREPLTDMWAPPPFSP